MSVIFFFNVNYICFSCKCFYISLSNKFYLRLCVRLNYQSKTSHSQQRQRIMFTYTPVAKLHLLNLYIQHVAPLPEDKINNILKEIAKYIFSLSPPFSRAQKVNRPKSLLSFFPHQFVSLRTSMLFVIKQQIKISDKNIF